MMKNAVLGSEPGSGGGNRIQGRKFALQPHKGRSAQQNSWCRGEGQWKQQGGTDLGEMLK